MQSQDSFGFNDGSVSLTEARFTLQIFGSEIRIGNIAFTKSIPICKLKKADVTADSGIFVHLWKQTFAEYKFTKEINNGNISPYKPHANVTSIQTVLLF